MVYQDHDLGFVSELNRNFEFGYFEGDLGSLWGGFSGQVSPFTVPFSVGAIPMFIQNGYWIDDAFLGMAATIPAKNSAWLDWSNFDVTFFYGFDKLNSPAMQNDDNAARVYGVASWIEPSAARSFSTTRHGVGFRPAFGQ